MRSIKEIGRNLKNELDTYRRLMVHPRTPRISRWLLWLALGYLAMPFDLIPDFIPFIGMLDDAIIIPLFIYLALRNIPDPLISQIRHEVDQES